MGTQISKLCTTGLSDKDMLESFIIAYMSNRGPTPYNMHLLPGGSLKEDDDEKVIRHKFRMALQQQRELGDALHGINNRQEQHHLSPHVITDFSLDGDLQKKDRNMYSCTWSDERGGITGKVSSRAKYSKPTLNSGERGSAASGMGTLDRLISGGFSSEEELMAFDCRKSPEPRTKWNMGKEKRARSRPEKAARIDPAALLQRRQVKSETQVPPDAQASEVFIEKIPLGGDKRKKRTWPPKENVLKVLKDERNRPTTYFLGRFRKNSTLPFVEIDYRFNSRAEEGGKESPEYFQCKGELEELLGDGESRIRYQADKINNNLEQKPYFLENVVYFFNTFEGRIWWNGYLFTLEGPVESRIHLAAIQMDPPSLTFELQGLHHVSVCRAGNELTINGNSSEGGVGIGAARHHNKSFRIRGKTEQDIKLVGLSHEPGTVQLSVFIPLLSGIPVSKRKSNLKVGQQKSKSKEMLEEVPKILDDGEIAKPICCTAETGN